ncbi:MAG: ABC transporter permease, partial [Planctomycetota bacterium]
SIFGVIAGTAVMMLLNNLILLLKIADRLEFTIIGLVILLGVFMDETVRRIAARRRAKKTS